MKFFYEFHFLFSSIMVTQERYENAIQFCLKEMFLRVGENYPNKDLTNHDRWFTMKSWTIEEERNFSKWMTSYLCSSLKFTKKRARSETSYFLLEYGWTNIIPLTLKVIYNETANVQDDYDSSIRCV